MTCRRLLSIAFLLTACMVGGTTSAQSASQSTLPTDTQASGISPSLRPMVRIRKLHLVRPDLIQYPISFEVYC